MINKIIDAISNALFNDFGETYKIYTDELKQGHNAPCFSIFCINPSRKHFFGNKYMNRNLFMVLYFPSNTDEPSFEINDITERLFNCLEYITESNDLIRGTGMKSETIDGVLNFMVQYNLYTINTTEKADLMGELDGLETVKG